MTIQVKSHKCYNFFIINLFYNIIYLIILLCIQFYWFGHITKQCYIQFMVLYDWRCNKHVVKIILLYNLHYFYFIYIFFKLIYYLYLYILILFLFFIIHWKIKDSNAFQIKLRKWLFMLIYENMIILSIHYNKLANLFFHFLI